MNSSLGVQDFNELLRDLATPSALTEAAVLLGCLGLSWVACMLLRRMVKVNGAVIFGRNVVDGVLFPLVALVLAVIARHLLMGVVKVAVFRVAIPILLSLALIRFAVRVLSAAFPNSSWMRAIERTISWIAWIAVVLWITGVMPAVLEELDSVRWQVAGGMVSLRTMIEGALTAGVVMVMALWLSSAIERKIIHGTGDDLSMRKMVSNIVRALLLFVGLLFAMSAVGINLTALSVLGGAVGVGLGFGLQKIAANYISGFVILAERSLRIGDMVKVDNFEGRVTDIRTRYTVIRSLGGREAVVPNEMLITQRVENLSLADPRVLIQTMVQVAYGTDVRALQPKLVAAILTVERVIDDPAPGVQLSNFAADGMDLTINFWIRDPENGQGQVKSDVHLAVLDVLNAEDIQIPFPQRVMHTIVRHEGADGAPIPAPQLERP